MRLIVRHANDVGALPRRCCRAHLSIAVRRVATEIYRVAGLFLPCLDNVLQDQAARVALIRAVEKVPERQRHA